ncbi:MAG: FtsQ-type POTRA domain-containing protein [Deltaproteobacteria bacterium]|nr:FtsQ-type POTRA domain-containing protein [Deltaproteobacteria bacterium]MCB9787855.1 FtsQ-type POTRA domain-containing protein [Deltaproteobacteria bacterium]
MKPMPRNRRRAGIVGRLRTLLPSRRARTAVDDVVSVPRPTEPLPPPPEAPTRAPRNARRENPFALLLGWLLPMMAALLAFTTPFVGARAYEYIMRSGHFYVREVLVSGNQHLSPGAVRDLAGIRPGTHVLAADLDAMKAALESDPWVARARVDRELPDRLTLHIDEHQPAAYVALGELMLVDVAGEPFTVADPHDDQELPIVTGIREDAFDDEATSAQARADLRAAINLNRLYEAMGLAGRWPVGEVRVEAGRRLTLVLSETGTEAVLGTGPYRQKLYRLEWVLEELHDEGKKADYVLLDNADGLGPDEDDGRVVVAADLAPSPEEAAQEAARRAEAAVAPANALLPSGLGGAAGGDAGAAAEGAGEAADDGVVGEDEDAPAVEGPRGVSASVRPAVEPEWLDERERAANPDEADPAAGGGANDGGH